VARIHLVGASGAGTTTLGRALAARLGAVHFDTDDFFWLPTDPPFEKIRERAERQALLGVALAREPAWVLSGSLCGWGDIFHPPLHCAGRPAPRAVGSLPRVGGRLRRAARRPRAQPEVARTVAGRAALPRRAHHGRRQRRRAHGRGPPRARRRPL